MEKVWKQIPGYEGLYEVSSDGEVRSNKRATTSGKILKQYVSKRNGYCYVCLSKDNKATTKRVHGLVASAFFGERVEGSQINHKDGNKRNNRVENLEYCTQSENMRHAYKMGLEKTVGIAVVNLDTGKTYRTATDAARDVSKGKAQGEMVARVCRGERSHYRGEHFAFLKDYQNGTIPEYKGKTKRKASVTLWA